MVVDGSLSFTDSDVGSLIFVISEPSLWNYFHKLGVVAKLPQGSCDIFVQTKIPQYLATLRDA